jgi:repressor LexA
VDRLIGHVPVAQWQFKRRRRGGVMQGLTAKQGQVLACIQRWVQRTGQAPSYRELATELGVTVRAAYQHVQALERKGALERTRRHRGLRLASEHTLPAGLPIIGRVAAGTPILAVENIEGYLEIDRLLGDRSTLFALQVKGDSMVDRQIYEGDYVIVRAQPWVEHGDIGVIAIDEEITVKTVLHRRTGLWLKPENQRQGYALIHLRPEQHIRLVGKVIAVFRPIPT